MRSGLLDNFREAAAMISVAVWQPFKSWQGARFNDRFTLSVALGTGRVEWTLLLDAERPSAPPDLVLDEESEALLRGVRYAELQGIREWDASVSSALLWLVSSIRTHLLAAARLDVLTSAGDAVPVHPHPRVVHAVKPARVRLN
jgi:hypothetical protein